MEVERLESLKKTLRFIQIYGLSRTLFKVMGRLRAGFALLPSFGVRDIGLIGCGQFGFATIGYFVSRKSKHHFRRAFDLDKKNQETFERFHRLAHTTDVRQLLDDPSVHTVYIASNHHSHTPYAIEAIHAGKDVYIEKPISVSPEQFAQLVTTVRSSKQKIYAGYNRPHSQAVRSLRGWCSDTQLPFTLSCFISGHKLEADHWYRDSKEGTRICGNVGHWLDLAVHMLSWGNLPDKWRISLAWSDPQMRDDDLAISMVSDRGDLVNIVLTARTEPFEGINETINLEWGNTIAKIEDFRSMTIWRGSKKKKLRFWPKDVGHENAILQPFSDEKRDWREVELSTLLMLHITDMVRDGQAVSEFSFSGEWDKNSQFSCQSVRSKKELRNIK